jgi:hypothetical protein
MRVYLVTYADGRRVHLWNQNALVRSAKGKGFDTVLAFRRDDLPEAFRHAHRDILDQSRGAGYWLWKPWLILECLRRAEEGDIVVYLDAGILVRRPLQELIEQVNECQLLLARNFTQNAIYVKRDCFILTGTDVPECHAARQIAAAVMLIKNTEANRGFVRTWFEYCADERILTDLPNQCGAGNLPGHVAHRHDQAVLSVLVWRERARLNHALRTTREMRKYFLHHRRRRARVPILVWHYRARFRRWWRERQERRQVQPEPRRS